LPVTEGRQDRVALAPNWRTVLAVDAGIGLVVFVAGVALMFLWDVVVGAFIAAGGCTYVTVVARRYLQWQKVRHDAGLDR
jgi:hypothetical protein